VTAAAVVLGENPLRGPLAWWEEWVERAAIIEADTGCSREEAERQAEVIVRRRAEREPEPVAAGGPP